MGLTRDETGADEGEPDSYYPSGYRNFVRIVPRDTVQGVALARVMRGDGCSLVAVVHDRGLYGASLARNIRGSARDIGMSVYDETVESTSASHQRAIASRVASRGADCMVFSGDTKSGAVAIVTYIARALPSARLYGADGVADQAFTDYERGGLPVRIANRVRLTLPVLGTAGLTNPPARRFTAAFERAHPDNKSPDA